MTTVNAVVIKASDELDVNDYINCFLADKEIREGFLFQTIDHKEYSPEEPISKNILLLVKKHFKNLNHLPFNQGVLLSRKVFDKEHVEKGSELGKILGFPCECPKYPSKKTRYGYDIVVVLKMSMEEEEEFREEMKEWEEEKKEMWKKIDFNTNHTIISFMSLEASHQTTLTQTEIIKNILLNDETFELRSRVVDVKLVVTPVYTPSYLIDILLKPNHPFTEDELFEISNVWYNHIGENHLDEFKLFLDDKNKMINPVNRGIIIGILLFSENNAESVFYPIQNHGVTIMEKHDKIKEELETRMMEIMNKPKPYQQIIF